jgi:hypothetical protein
MRHTYLIAAAMAAALASGLATAAPTAVQAAAAPVKLYIAGSSAAKGAISSLLAADLCGGAANMTTFTSNPSGSPAGTADFNAFSCTAATGKPNAGQLTTVYYRAEGGSVVGVLPVYSQYALKQLDLSSCAAGSGGTITCPVAGSSGANGPTDNWGAGTTGHVIEMGVSDLEPGAFTGNANPTSGTFPYSAAVWLNGKTVPTKAQLNALTHTTLFQQTFGIVVNSALPVNDLSSAAIGQILAGNYVDWSSVPNTASATPGSTVTGATATPIFVCNRETGSGTRTGAALFFNGDGCVTGAPAITDSAGTTNDNWSTSEALNCVQNNGSASGAAAGSIAISYVSIDNFSKIGAGKTFPNVKLVTIDGVTPSNYNSAMGNYKWVYEATAQQNPTALAGNAAGQALVNYLIPAAQAVATAPQSAQINAIPSQPATNVPAIPMTAVGTTPIYVSNFSRGGGLGNSCNALSEAN